MTSDTEDKYETSTNPEFYEYYAAQSESKLALARSRHIYDIVTTLYQRHNASRCLKVLDVGCNAGTQSFVWAENGHDVTGLDINAPLVRLASSRAKARGLTVEFCVGTAEQLPFRNQSKDVCIVPELLEHVPDWESCINELDRVLRPGGVLLLTTTNIMCPIQEEFKLPLYSWYPSLLKRYFERLSLTTRPELVNHTKYPAIHWFSYFQLRRLLRPRGYICFDRFDVKAMKDDQFKNHLLIQLISHSRAMRWLAHIMTPYTFFVAVKQPNSREDSNNSVQIH